MKKLQTQAQLYLNDELVGDIDVQGVETAWRFGQFRPNDAFSKFAPHFGRWSLLMHEDMDRKVDRALSDALRAAEQSIDAIAAKLYYPSKDEWRRLLQLNIDGAMIEWIQYSTTE